MSPPDAAPAPSSATSPQPLPPVAAASSSSSPAPPAKEPTLLSPITTSTGASQLHPTAMQTDLRHVTSNPSIAPSPMKERTVSGASTDRDRAGRSALMSVSPPPHRVGSRSPASIPSSPTSVHSSSSAIFERDVEPSPSHPLVQSNTLQHPQQPPNPHRTPRSKATEALEQSVPSVLDSAAELLATTDGEFEESQIAIEAPVTFASAGASRSPSPTTSSGAGARNRTSMLLNLPSPVQSSIVPLSAMSISPRGSPPLSLTGSPTRQPMPLVTNFSQMSPSASTSASGPTLGEPAMPGSFAAPPPPRSSTPTSTGASSIGGTHYESAASSPTTTTMEHPPHPLPNNAQTPTTSTFSAQAIQHTPSSSSYNAYSPPGGYATLPTPSHGYERHERTERISHPPSPSHGGQNLKRLSFLAYTDILASTPVSTQPLSSLTSPATTEPPPHLPSVSLSVNHVNTPPGSGAPSASASAIVRSPGIGSRSPGFGSRNVSVAGSAAASARNSMFLSADSVFNDVKEPDSGGVDDDVGGEWEREGMGRGLEERLEALMAVGPGKA